LDVQQLEELQTQAVQVLWRKQQLERERLLQQQMEQKKHLLSLQQ